MAKAKEATLNSSYKNFSCWDQTENIYKIANEAFLREQYLISTQLFLNYSALGCDSMKRDEALFRASLAMYRLGDLVEADHLLGSIENEDSFKASVQLLRAWYSVERRALLASDLKRRFSQFDIDYEKISVSKKPWVAGVLSALVPGAGQIYNGNYQSAIYSFILNSLFLSAAIETQNKGLYATSLTTATVFSIVYLGNILNSIQGAEALNARERAMEEAQLQKKYFPEIFSR